MLRLSAWKGNSGPLSRAVLCEPRSLQALDLVRVLQPHEKLRRRAEAPTKPVRRGPSRPRRITARLTAWARRPPAGSPS